MSERTRLQLSYDFSPDASVCPSVPGGPDNLEGTNSGRPTSPTPPDDSRDLVFAPTSLGNFMDASPCSDDTDMCIITSGDLLYTHPEVDEEEDDPSSKGSYGSSGVGGDRPVSVDGGIHRRNGSAGSNSNVGYHTVGLDIANKVKRLSGSFPESSGSTSSSLQEFERLEAEILSSKQQTTSLTATPNRTPQKRTAVEELKTSGPPTSYSEPSLVDKARPTQEETLKQDKKESLVSTSSTSQETIEKKAKILSEIEEGHESQASDSGETVTGPLIDSTDTDDASSSEAALRSLERDVSVRKNVSSQQKKEDEIHEDFGTTQMQQQLPAARTTSISSMTTSSKDRTGSPGTPGGRSGSGFGGRHIILSRRGLSTDSNDSHGRSSISTANTESWLARMQDVERDSLDIDDDAVVDYEDDDNDQYQHNGDNDLNTEVKDKEPPGHQSLEGTKDSPRHQSKDHVSQDMIMKESLTQQQPTSAALVSSSDSSLSASGRILQVLKQDDDEFSEDSLKEQTASSRRRDNTRQEHREGCMLASADSTDLVDVMNWSFRSEVTSSTTMFSSVEFVPTEATLTEVGQDYDERLRNASTDALPLSVVTPEVSYSCRSCETTTSSSENKIVITEGTKVVEEGVATTTSSTTVRTATSHTSAHHHAETPVAKSASGGNNNNNSSTTAAVSS